MKSRTNRNIENGAMDKMEKRLNKISTAEMKKNMSEDTMTICECCEFLETMIGDDKNILDCINYIERKAKSMHSKLVQNKDEIKLLKFVKGTPMLLSEMAEQLFKECGFRKSNECTNPSYFKKDDPYAWINFSDTGVAISSQHELGYVHLDYELIKAIYTQMKELELIE